MTILQSTNQSQKHVLIQTRSSEADCVPQPPHFLILFMIPQEFIYLFINLFINFIIFTHGSPLSNMPDLPWGPGT